MIRDLQPQIAIIKKDLATLRKRVLTDEALPVTIYTGGAANFTLPNPALSANTGKHMFIANMGTGTLTLSYPIYKDATTSVTTLANTTTANKVHIYCTNSKWYIISGFDS